MWDILFPRPGLHVITVTDVTTAGRNARQASPDHPLYYVAVSGGYQDLGGYKAGEHEMPPRQVTANMYKVLAKQGYLPASSRHSPDLVLLWFWGTMNVERFGIPPMRGINSLQVNSWAEASFMGGLKAGLINDRPDPFQTETLPVGLARRTDDLAEAIETASTDDLFVAGVIAYDFAAAKQRKKVILWTTRISSPSRGFWLPEALPSMLAIAGPFLGRDTPKPVWIDASDKFRPDVTLGDSKVLGYIEETPPPPGHPGN